MLNFQYQNPVQLVFGKGMIGQVAELVPRDQKVLVTYGGGSIKKNGVYDQVVRALAGHDWLEFGGIEPNPCYETLMKAVAIVREQKVGFLLAVGGGSVLDGTKFIAAASLYEGCDPWEILAKHLSPGVAIPRGSVLTLPATGSEMNAGAVITKKATQEKLHFFSSAVFPRFSILDPETTYSLPPHQVSNGVVDAFVHVMEQYCTKNFQAPLQDRLAEGVLRTLVEEGPKALVKPQDYDVRANIMFCATNALNGWLGYGVVGDWSTHMIGHELTALYGIDHGQSLAVVLPGVLEHERERKAEKLSQYAVRVWRVRSRTEKRKIDEAITRTERFFHAMGVKTRLSDYGIPEEAVEKVAVRIREHWGHLGENGTIDYQAVQEILSLRF